MKLTPALLLLAAPALFTGSEVTFAPGEDTEIYVTFDQQSDLTRSEAEQVFSFNGEEQEPQYDERSVERSFVEKVVFADVVGAVADGQVMKLQRTYETIECTRSFSVETDEGSQEHETEEYSELTGSTVSFEWDAEAEEYKKVLDGDEERPDLLERLDVSGFLVEFLPDDEVEEGSEWEVDLEVFHILMYPGGNLTYVSEGMEEEEEEDREARIESENEWDESYRDNLEGSITATYKGTRDEDGVNVAVIALAIEVETTIVNEEESEGTIEINEEEMDADTTLTSTYTTSFDLEGELLWNIEAGYGHSLMLAGDTDSESTEERILDAGDFVVGITEREGFEGTIEYRYTFE